MEEEKTVDGYTLEDYFDKIYFEKKNTLGHFEKKNFRRKKLRKLRKNMCFWKTYVFWKDICFGKKCAFGKTRVFEKKTFDFGKTCVFIKKCF